MKTLCKSLFVAASLPLLISCGADSQSKVDDILVKRWKIEYGLIQGQKNTNVPKSPNNDFEFTKDHHYTFFVSNNPDITGTWDYNEKDSTVYLTMDNGETGGIIKQITSSEIVYTPQGKHIEGTFFENAKFFYTPISK